MRTLPIKEELQISGGFCLTMAVMLLVLPLDWLLAMAAAGFVHELAHILAVWLLGGRILSCRISAGGAVIETSPMESVSQLLCILAGPLGGLALLPLARFLPKLAVCAFVQSAYNLLPLFPLDGGRALGCLLELAAGAEKGERIFLLNNKRSNKRSDTCNCNRINCFTTCQVGRCRRTIIRTCWYPHCMHASNRYFKLLYYVEERHHQSC